MTECKIALVVGHKETAQGAANKALRLSEWAFNKDVATRVQEQVQECVVLYRRTYTKLPADVNAWNPKVVVELHCNATHDPLTNGTEMLHWKGSTKGALLAEIFQRRVVIAMGFRDRGLKPCTLADRGGYLLKHTNAPCVIAEPFFISCTRDLNMIEQDNRQTLVYAYVAACQEVLNTPELMQ